MKLYYMQGSCSLAPHLVMEELGIPYEGVVISGDRGDHDKPEFLKLNPKGATPVLVLDNGQPLTENVAILTYLADLKKEKNLLPAAGSFERIRALEWLAYLGTEVHKSFNLQFAPHGVFAGNEPVISAVTGWGKQMTMKQFDYIESKLPSSGFALGATYSVVDAYLFVFFSWAKYKEYDLSRWPKYGALAARIAERPATLAVLKQEDLLD
jgi:glutathione S-transferase